MRKNDEIKWQHEEIGGKNWWNLMIKMKKWVFLWDLVTFFSICCPNVLPHFPISTAVLTAKEIAYLARVDVKTGPQMCKKTTWWLIPVSKWIITPIINGLTLLIQFITGIISHLRAVGWATKYKTRKKCTFELKVTACAPAISFYQRAIWGKKDAAMSRQFARYGSGNPHRCQDNGT